jgi:hypothetical protein
MHPPPPSRGWYVAKSHYRAASGGPTAYNVASMELDAGSSARKDHGIHERVQ